MPDADEAQQITFATLIAHFIGHVSLVSVGFAALAVPAILFSLAAHYLAAIPVSPFVVEVLLAMHYLLLGVDVLTFIAYISVSIYEAAIQLRGYVRGLHHGP